jgi:hypothetical protein
MLTDDKMREGVEGLLRAEDLSENDDYIFEVCGQVLGGITGRRWHRAYKPISEEMAA